MTKRLPIQFRANPSSEDVDAIANGLNRFNLTHGIDDHHAPFVLVIEDDHGDIVGGLSATMFFGWLAIDLLWVDDRYRGLGYGSELLQQAEAIGREHGCRLAFLNTLSFQAPAFYESHGYTAFAELHNDTHGFNRHYFQKKL